MSYAPGLNVTFQLADPAASTRINGGVADVTVMTDGMGGAEVMVTGTGAALAPLIVRFTAPAQPINQKNAEYPQTFTIPVCIQ